MSNQSISSYNIQSERGNIEDKVDDEYDKLEQNYRQLTPTNQHIERNILLLGSTKSGKTTLVEVLADPRYRPPYQRLGLSQNQLATKKKIKCSTSTHFTLTIVEIPGNMLDKEQDLAKINETCIELGVTQFHYICVCTSFENGISDKDIKLFERLIKHFGEASIKPYLSLIVTRCESKDEESRANMKKELNRDFHFSRLMQWFNRRVHFIGALDPIDWDQGYEEVILDQFQTIYNDRQNFLQFIEHDCNIEPFTIESQMKNSSVISSSENTFSVLSIEIKSEKCERYPTFHVDESYNITIEDVYGKIQANTIWGALHGLTTFSQLHFVTDGNQLVINALITIEDEPRFPYRGILLDTSRNFLRTSVIKKHLDMMAYNKFNVLHWRIVGDQSWPLISKQYPTLTEKGAFSLDHVYTPGDVQDTIEYARLRGIRIIPELNAPGHIGALGRAFPDFLINCYNESTRQIIDPTKTEIYSFIEIILKEIKQTFENEFYIHLGMDEVYSACCTSNLNLEKFMNKNKMSKYTDLMRYYTSKILDIAQNIGAKSMVWQDVWNDDVKLPLEVVIEIWKDDSWSTYLSKAINEGYNVVLAAPFNLSMMSYRKYDKLDSVMNAEFSKWYNIDLFANFIGDETARKRLIGGEATLCGEFVDDFNSLSRFWPRALVVAEKLWSLPDVNNMYDVTERTPSPITNESKYIIFEYGQVEKCFEIYQNVCYESLLQSVKTAYGLPANELIVLFRPDTNRYIVPSTAQDLLIDTDSSIPKYQLITRNETSADKDGWFKWFKTSYIVKFLRK
ncbi:unnamed protein product [Rotaria sordida]|uniref:beta-N-acetylhexosaminidase n=1 Tax=Rotaria sordida TaxID=392033 RepID=A0A814EGP3_9BILA|nr:unnamed protein product [Rotaria sordida]